MKIILALVVVVLLVVAALFFFGSGDLAIAPKKQPGVVDPNEPRLDFSALATLLQKDMSNVPVSLDAPRIAPANAFSVKSRLGSAAGVRPEYQVIVQVCDLIIYADQQHAAQALNAQHAQQGVFTDLMASAETQQTNATTQRAALRAKAQSNWDSYRRQTSAEVDRLLASLPHTQP